MTIIDNLNITETGSALLSKNSVKTKVNIQTDAKLST